jgi:hypothetical protein
MSDGFAYLGTSGRVELQDARAIRSQHIPAVATETGAGVGLPGF